MGNKCHCQRIVWSVSIVRLSVQQCTALIYSLCVHCAAYESQQQKNNSNYHHLTRVSVEMKSAHIQTAQREEEKKHNEIALNKVLKK